MQTRVDKFKLKGVLKNSGGYGKSPLGAIGRFHEDTGQSVSQLVCEREPGKGTARRNLLRSEQ